MKKKIDWGKYKDRYTSKIRCLAGNLCDAVDEARKSEKENSSLVEGKLLEILLLVWNALNFIQTNKEEKD